MHRHSRFRPAQTRHIHTGRVYQRHNQTRPPGKQSGLSLLTGMFVCGRRLTMKLWIPYKQCNLVATWTTILTYWRDQTRLQSTIDSNQCLIASVKERFNLRQHHGEFILRQINLNFYAQLIPRGSGHRVSITRSDALVIHVLHHTRVFNPGVTNPKTCMLSSPHHIPSTLIGIT